jgi:hypothetical protein
MATTTNGIYYPTSGDNIAPLESHFSTMATSIDTAVKKIESGSSSTFTVGTSVGNSNEVTITFASAFSAAPSINATLEMTAAGSAYALAVHSVTTTTFKVKVTRVNGTSNDGNLQIDWIARL